MEIQITKESYDSLMAAGAIAWGTDDDYFTDTDLLSESAKALVAEAPYYLIWDFVRGYTGLKTRHPGDIIFPQQLDRYLPKKVESQLGQPLINTRYADTTYTQPVTKIEYAFERDDDDLELELETKTFSWMLSDGTWSPDTKVVQIPFDDKKKKAAELKKRRNNVIQELKELAAAMGIGDYVVELFEAFPTEEDIYVKSGSQALYKAIRDDDDIEWLDEDLPNGLPARAAILQYLAVGLVKGIPEEDAD